MSMIKHRKAGGLVVALAALAITVLIAPVASATFVPPDQWAEDGDAGDTCASAQRVTDGKGSPLNRIDGNLSGAADEDVYKIAVIDPANFSATTVGTGTAFDTQLFLFNKHCQGVIGNDDAGPDLQAELAAGNVAPGPPAVYHLAISSFDNDPLNCSSELIFQSFPFGPVYGPMSSNPQDQVLCSWSGNGGEAGDYGILLTGAVFLP